MTMNKHDIDMVCAYLAQLKNTYEKTQDILIKYDKGASFESSIIKFNIDKIEYLIKELKSLSSL